MFVCSWSQVSVAGWSQVSVPACQSGLHCSCSCRCRQPPRASCPVFI
ncbi:hypothetical protein [Methanimicrococcus hongohii]|nr:hypothetical protein [Methanimicrococcus sp. Hf6]